MGLVEVQRTLARLYTDGDLRDRFFADPEQAGRALGLTPPEIGQLASLQKEMCFFAASLQHKRAGEVARLLPLTRRALGSQFRPLFLLHAGAYIPSGTKKHRDDACAFAASLRTRLGVASAERRTPNAECRSWIPDLARYEAACLRAADGHCGFQAILLRWRVDRLTRLVDSEGELPAPTARPCIAFLVRLSAEARPRQLVLGLPVPGNAGSPWSLARGGETRSPGQP